MSFDDDRPGQAHSHATRRRSDNAPDRSPDLRQEVAEGLLHAYGRLNARTSETLEVASSFLYALIELLDERKRVMRQLAQLHMQSISQLRRHV